MEQNKNKMPKFQIDYTNFGNAAFIQKFIQRQLWAAGGRYITDTNANVNTPVKWGGQSRFLVGFNFFATNPQAHTISVILNQETIIDSVPMIALQPLGNLRFLQYFEFIRPLSGSDVMVFNTTSTVAEEVGYAIYMTRDYNRYYVRD